LAPLAGEEIASVSWSEAGQEVRLSLVPSAPGAPSEALLVALDGEVRPMTRDDAGNAEWTVGGRRVWMESTGTNSRLRLQTPEGEQTLASGPFRLWAAAAAPSASSDGSLALVTLSQQRPGDEGAIYVWLIRSGE